MNRPLFEGKLIRLVALEPERDAEIIASWGKDSDYQRLLDISPAVRYNARLVRSWYEKEGQQGHAFMIQTLVDGQMIGFIELGGFDWAAGTAWVGIGIGEREYQGKGYGTDAMMALLFYAFTELNLHRVNLNVFPITTGRFAATKRQVTGMKARNVSASSGKTSAGRAGYGDPAIGLGTDPGAGRERNTNGCHCSGLNLSNDQPWRNKYDGDAGILPEAHPFWEAAKPMALPLWGR